MQEVIFERYFKPYRKHIFFSLNVVHCLIIISSYVESASNIYKLKYVKINFFVFLLYTVLCFTEYTFIFYIKK